MIFRTESELKIRGIKEDEEIYSCAFRANGRNNHPNKTLYKLLIMGQIYEPINKSKIELVYAILKSLYDFISLPLLEAILLLLGK